MKLLAALSAVLFSATVSAAPLHNMVVFGDSLSDNGNLYQFMKRQLPQSPPYFEGRFSNGPVWIENLAASYFPKDMNNFLFDYAFGGAGVSEEDDDALFTLKREINTYLVAHNDKASADSLFVVWIGANNYLSMPEDIEQTLIDVNTGIRKSLELLASKGAKHILVLNLPDLGRIPAAYEFGSADTLSYFSNQHNKTLDNTLAEMKQKHPEVEWLFYDLKKTFDNITEHPELYGITNVRGTCSNTFVNKIVKKTVLNMVAKVQPLDGNETCDNYLFFDLVHPTAVAHKVLSDDARTMLDKAGIEFVTQ